MNISIYGIFLHSILQPSAYFQIAKSSTTFSLQCSTFSHFVSPVIRINNINSARSLSVFNSIFKFSKALEMESHSGSKCKSSKILNLDHQSHSSTCIDFIDCKFLNCSSLEYGGAVEVSSCNISFNYCIFRDCSSKFGGSIYSTHSKKMIVNQTSIVGSRAERFGAIYSDSRRFEFSTNISFTNISKSIGTIYIAGIRVETTRPNFQFVKFVSTYSKNFGAIWDWSTKPTTSIYFSCEFSNVTSDTPGAAITLYHWLQQAHIENCIFHGSKGPDPIYIYFFSSESDVLIQKCKFDLPENSSIGQRYDGNNITSVNNTFAL
ncbi:hypothetical protein M9Y10_036174 [Tritrichomonas musculus]|uniref:Right handed beta helix domain-containing protein n=1 Tax=Tritrichomonas musculus TaxID=1915356 RepID=A0ABR2GVN0_9EUKA